MNLSNLTNFNNTELHETFDLQVPHGYLPPTCHYQAQGGKLTTIMDVFYELKLTVKVLGMRTDMNFSIPVVVGTESLLEQYYLQTNDYDEIPISYLAALEEINLPPSYESVIKNFKSEQLITVY